MAKYNTSRYQYETSPRKLQPEYIPTKKKYPKKSTVRKSNIKNQNKKEETININSKIILYIGIVFIILFAISYRNALIAQTYSQVKELKSELSEVVKSFLFQIVKKRLFSHKKTMKCDFSPFHRIPINIPEIPLRMHHNPRKNATGLNTQPTSREKIFVLLISTNARDLNMPRQNAL